MTQNEISQYLANIFVVAVTDGFLSPKEESAFDEIASSLKAKKKEISDAKSMVSKTDFQPIPIGCFSDQIRNIEDMVFVSLSDGELGEAEKKIIANFAKQIGITQEQINKIWLFSNKVG